MAGTDIGNGVEPLWLAQILGMGWSPYGWHIHWEWDGAYWVGTDIGNGAGSLEKAQILGTGRSP